MLTLINEEDVAKHISFRIISDDDNDEDNDEDEDETIDLLSPSYRAKEPALLKTDSFNDFDSDSSSSKPVLSKAYFQNEGPEYLSKKSNASSFRGNVRCITTSLAFPPNARKMTLLARPSKAVSTPSTEISNITLLNSEVSRLFVVRSANLKIQVYDIFSEHHVLLVSHEYISTNDKKDAYKYIYMISKFAQIELPLNYIQKQTLAAVEADLLKSLNKSLEELISVIHIDETLSLIWFGCFPVGQATLLNWCTGQLLDVKSTKFDFPSSVYCISELVKHIQDKSLQPGFWQKDPLYPNDILHAIAGSENYDQHLTTLMWRYQIAKTNSKFGFGEYKYFLELFKTEDDFQIKIQICCTKTPEKLIKSITAPASKNMYTRYEQAVWFTKKLIDVQKQLIKVVSKRDNNRRSSLAVRIANPNAKEIPSPVSKSANIRCSKRAYSLAKRE